MPTIFVRCMLFVSSYFPLTLIICFLFVSQQPLLAGGTVGIGLIGVICTYVYCFGNVAKMEPMQVKLSGQQEKDGDVMGYIASYIVPFVTFPLNGWQQIATLSVFILVLGVIYINSSSMIRINPMLSVAGFHLYDITVENDPEIYSLFTRRRIKRGEPIRIVDVGRGIYLEKMHERNRSNKK